MGVLHGNPFLLASGTPTEPTFPLQRSLRFRGANSAYLSRTPAVAGNRKTFTFSYWVKRGALASSQEMYFVNSGSGNFSQISWATTNTLTVTSVNSSVAQCELITSSVYRDPAAWYHIVVSVDTTQAIASNRVKIYVNSVQITAFNTATYPSLNYDFQLNNTTSQNIGRPSTGTLDGYLTEFNFIDGQALTPSSFGGYNSGTGVWEPRKYAGTYGTNGFYLNFQDNSAATAAAIGKDSSGNGNNWTPNGISVTPGVTYDSMTDVPTLTSPTTANYATLNPLGGYLIGGPTLADGNLNYGQGAAAWSSCGSTFQPNIGKWYFEVSSPVGASNYCAGGLRAVGNIGASEYAGSTSGSYGAALTSAQLTAYSGGVAGGNITGTFSFATPIQIAVDFDSGKIWIGISNGTWIGGGNPVTGTTPTYTFTANTQLIPYVSAYANNVYFNSGQRPFIYTQPTGFKALNTYNLPTPTIPNGATQFAATLWTGDGADPRAINNSGSMQPDLVWIKARGSSTLSDHVLDDSVRGATKDLFSNLTAAEGANNSVRSFNTNGFSVGNSTRVNQNSIAYVGWQWKASNAAAVTNTSGSISSQVSANPSAGFSIVTINSPGSGTFTFGHGLGVAPRMMIVKSRTTVTSWLVYHASATTTTSQYLVLNSTAATATVTNIWGTALPTSSVAGGLGNQWGLGTDNYVAYCFSEIAGYSKFGSYTGNGSTDGPFVYLGFRPRFVLIKNSSVVSDWIVFDSARNTYNVTNSILQPNTSGAEFTGAAYNIDFTSNGFKLRNTTNANINGSGNTHIYAAFAESPFNYSLAR